jgi:hypothetical protein
MKTSKKLYFYLLGNTDKLEQTNQIPLQDWYVKGNHYSVIYMGGGKLKVKDLYNRKLKIHAHVAWGQFLKRG